MPTNWKKLYAMKEKAKKQLLMVNPMITNGSGIYMLTRTDENQISFCYVGQARHLMDRLVSHMLGYSQRIDISLKKRGLFDLHTNLHGWKVSFKRCKIRELNDKEHSAITYYLAQGFQLYNKTLGSQGKGKISINDGQSTKGYRDGVEYGYKKAIKEISEYFIKYLDFQPKLSCCNKDGSITKIAERKYEELMEMLKCK